MVDNEKQWEDMEYSEDSNEAEEYSSEYEDDGYDEESDEEYEDYDEDDDEAPAQKKSNPLPMIIIFVVLVGVIAFIMMSKLGGGNQNVANNQVMPEQNNNYYSSNMPEENNQPSEQSTDELANSFFNEAGGETENNNENMMSVNFNESGETNVATGEGENQPVATVTESKPADTAKESDLFDNQTEAVTSNAQENNAIMVVYNKASRANPFKPPIVEKSKLEDVPFELINNTQFEIIEPPKESIVDENLTRLLKTQISGILFDKESPSAIVNLNGLDHFVKVGDTVSGYKINSITRDKVEISYKNNTYVASVGELFTPGTLEKQQAVANLERKFAGRYK